MMKCVRCGEDKPDADFYANDRTCKPCRCAMVRANRAAKAEQYAAYEKGRASLDHRVAARRAYASTEAGKAAHARAVRSSDSRSPDRRAARVTLGNAVRDGAVERWPCEVCGKKAHGHHVSYTDPLLVTWLCAAHHRQAHLLTKGES